MMPSGDVLCSRRYGIGTTVHGALDDSALNSGGQVVTAGHTNH